ncbi:hypothetical protein AAFF_G00441610 [Aldrovandia affinis]|uniref:KRAB domain-containing protein n=1 Tax=Aldrovandia affinis TaxID=143900 RepID=A0AAD7S7W2_9TELE|nr:hypothetical protein AAFF_G00441610 [Aldrovandia affinis]
MSSSEKENLEKLSVYFSKTEWTSLQKCEKVHYKNIKRNHEAMLAIDCEECDSSFTDACTEVHGPPTFVSDSPAPLGAPSRAQLTLPLSLEVRVSGIPGAGLGVFNRDQRLPVGVHFGPYEGELTDEDKAIDSGYSWMLRSCRLLPLWQTAECQSNWLLPWETP